MKVDEDQEILAKARDLLKDLNEDLQTAPEDLLPEIYGFTPRLEEAIVRFKQAFAADPRHWAARTALGELLLKIRRDDEAITVLRGTVDKNPNYALAWYDLAFALRSRSQYAPAVDAM